MKEKWQKLISKIKRKWRKFKKNHKKPTWTKLTMFFMFAVCLEIIIYAEVAMWRTWDMSCLYALVGVAASLSASIWAYCEKAKAENTAGGITYDTAVKKSEPEPNEDGTYG